VSKLNKSQFVHKMQFDMSRLRKKKDILINNYEGTVCRNNWKIVYSAGEKRRERT
jgi:hypothetical protein